MLDDFLIDEEKIGGKIIMVLLKHAENIMDGCYKDERRLNENFNKM